MEYITKFNCPDCHFEIDDESLIKSHVQKGKHLKFLCIYCRKCFPSLYTVNSHQKTYHSNFEVCHKYFESIEGTENEVFVCALCNFSIKCLQTMKQHQHDSHQLLGHREQFYMRSATSELKTEKPRSETEIKFDQKNQPPSHHMDTNLFYKCSCCQRWLGTLAELNDHSLQAHGVTEPLLQVSFNKEGNLIGENLLSKFFCLYCNAANYTFIEAKDHFKSHGIKNRPFQYISAKPLQEPQLLEEATFKCTICDFSPEAMNVIKNHWDKEHADKILKIARLYAKIPPRNHVCEHCKNTYPYQIMKTLHIEAFHKDHNVEALPPAEKRPKLDPPQSLKENENVSLPIITNVFSLTTVEQNAPPVATAPQTSTSNELMSVKEDKYQCFYCPKSYKVYERLQQHHNKEHSSFAWFYLFNKCLDNGACELLSSDDKIFRCSYCLENFGKNFTEFSLHYKEKHMPLPIKYSIQDGSDGFKMWKPFKHNSMS